MRIYPAVHYTMGGLWVDYNLMTNVPGLYVLGEANFSDHGANRLGASALMQGLADGYFVLPYTIGDYLAGLLGQTPVPTDDPAFAQAEAEHHRRDQALAVGRRHQVRRTTSTASSARSCGTTAAWRATRTASRRRSREIPALREEFRKNVRVLGGGEGVNQSLEKAGRVADFFELGRADVPRRPRPRGVLRRPLPRRAPDRRGRGPARRRELRLRRRLGVARARATPPDLHKEPLEFENVQPSSRTYK